MKRLAEYIKEHKITQRQLAQQIGVTECAISRYLSGQRVPRLSTARKIAQAIGVSIDELC